MSLKGLCTRLLCYSLFFLFPSFYYLPLFYVCLCTFFSAITIHYLRIYLMQSNRDLESHLYPYISEVWDMVASFGDLGRVCRSTFRCTCNCSPSKLPSGVSSGSGSAIRNKGKNPSFVDDGSISTSCVCIAPIKLLHNHVKVSYSCKVYHCY